MSREGADIRLPACSLPARLLVALMAVACAPPTAPILPLQPDDFTLRGVPADADSTEIRLTFGDPETTVESQNPFDDNAPLVTWIYDGFEVRFGGASAPIGYLIEAPGESTARGVMVGDPAERLIQLYGAPMARFEPGWTYADTMDGSLLHVIDAFVESDTIRRIYIGRALE
jgi:hypothetical protein